MAALTPMSHGSNTTGTSAGVHRHTHSEIFLVLGVPSDSLRNLTFGCRTGHWVPGTALEGRERCCLPSGWRQVQVPPCVTPNRGCSLLLGVCGGLIFPLCREVGGGVSMVLAGAEWLLCVWQARAHACSICDICRSLAILSRRNEEKCIYAIFPEVGLDFF